NDGDRSDPGHLAAPLSFSPRRPHPGGREGKAGRRPEERHRERALLPGSLSGAPDHARRPDPRGDGPGRRDPAAARHRGPPREADLLHGHRPRQVPPPGRPRRSAPDGGGDPEAAIVDLQAARFGYGRGTARGRGGDSLGHGGSRGWTMRHAGALVDPRAAVDPEAVLGEATTVGPFAVVGPRVVVGARVRIAPNAVVMGPT